MKLLLLGSGGREHALAWKIAQSPKIENYTSLQVMPEHVKLVKCSDKSRRFRSYQRICCSKWYQHGSSRP